MRICKQLKITYKWTQELSGYFWTIKTQAAAFQIICTWVLPQQKVDKKLLNCLSDTSQTSMLMVEVMINIKFSWYEIIYEKLNSILNKLTTIPDRITKILLQKCLCSIVHPGIFQKVWKNSCIKPIFESGMTENIENYRWLQFNLLFPNHLTSW